MGVNQMTGTPWHLETLHMSEDDERRHKSRCIHYKKANKSCAKFKTKCPGSAHCDYYKEDPARVRATPEPERLPYSTPRIGTTAAVTPINTSQPTIQPANDYDVSVFIVGCHVKHDKYGPGIVSNIDGNYISIDFDNGLKKEMDLDYCVKKALLSREYTEEEIRIAKEKEEAERKAKEEQRLQEIERQKLAQFAQQVKPQVTAVNVPTNNQHLNVAAASRTPVYVVSSNPNAYNKPISTNIQSNKTIQESNRAKTMETLSWSIWLLVAILLSSMAIAYCVMQNTWYLYVEFALMQLYASSQFYIYNPFTTKISKVPIIRWARRHYFFSVLLFFLIWSIIATYVYLIPVLISYS